MWEKKIRQIEKGEYDPKLFLDEMKEMVAQLVSEVKLETKKMIVIEQDVLAEEKKPSGKINEKKEENAAAPASAGPKKPAMKKAVEKPEEQVPLTCPKCKKGTMLKGKTAFGCSEYKSGCTFKVMFEHYGKLLNDKQIFTLIQKGKSPKIKGLRVNGETIDSALVLDSSFNVIPESKKEDEAKDPDLPSLF